VKFSLSNRVACLALAFALVVCGAATFAQQGASTIRGTVTDPTGAVVPGAKVRITNLATNQVREQTTSSAGTFNFELIPVGDYKVEIEATGFKKKVITPLRALVGSIAEVKGEMEVGDISSVVTVEATSTAIQINTQDASLGNNIVSQQIIQLPMEARNVGALLTLQPGVTGAPGAEGYVSGARSDQSNITLDGVDINEAQTNSLGSPVLRLNSEAIEEFKVTTVNANANQGRSSAAQINLVTKSGSNQFKGSLFYYHRNTIFTANDFFSNRSGTDRAKLLRNVYGGTVGGPIAKDKLFFFYSYEGRKDRSDTTLTRVVPLANLGQGIINVDVANCSASSCPTYRVTVNSTDLATIFPSLLGVNPTAVSVLAAAASAYPANDTSQGDTQNTGGYRFNVGTPVNLGSHVAKLDWNITSNMTTSVRMTRIFDTYGLTPQFPDTPPAALWEHPWGMALAHTWQFKSNWTNSFRYGFTRQAFTQIGDSTDNSISFRFVFSPRRFVRDISRKTPVHNFVNDVSYVRGTHTINFGTNIRLIRNNRETFANSYDSAITNPSFYLGGGNVISVPVRNYLRTQLGQSTLVLRNNSSVQNAATALLGRFTQYGANFLFDSNGQPLSFGDPSVRGFATEEYDLYAMDTWKITRNITLTYGLRYGISRPVYERTGFEVKPNMPLNEFLARRAESANNGVNYSQRLTIDRSGPSNDRSPMYKWDKNNFQPRVAVAWSPNIDWGPAKFLFGEGGKSVIRVGFAMTNDYYGQALAVAFDLNNTLGFSTSSQIQANTFNTSTAPPPLFTGFNQDIRTLPFITTPPPLVFPLVMSDQDPNGYSRRIESSLDEGLVAPKNYVYNLTFERELPKGFMVQASYVARLGRNLLASRDVMSLSNLRDPVSGQTWYEAATILEQQRQLGTPIANIQPIPWFENMLPAGYINVLDACAVCGWTGWFPLTLSNTQAVYGQAFDFWANDWTDIQAEIEAALGQFLFFHPQWGALSSWGTIANSNYHGGSLSVRQRTRDLQWDFNYTFSHSLDDASGLQTSGTYGSSFILNPFLQQDNYGHSDFDIRHQINANFIYELPFGRGKRFGSNVGHGLNALIGGWRLSGIHRWNTAQPIFAPYDDVRWATNWNVQSGLFAVQPIKTCPSRGDATTGPKLFWCNTTEAYQSFRNAYPGETGPRNPFRLDWYFNLDLGLTKSFEMPWNENHKLELRWEVFNVTNTQRMGDIDTSRTGFGVVADPALSNATPLPNWSNYTSIQGSPRVMQIGLRFQF
jgi:hypothetical protein